jgi:hypothetical protein
MSQQTATARVAARAPQRRQGTTQPLRVVAAATGKPGNALFAAFCMVLLGGGLMALLMLNTAMAEGSFTLAHLQNTSGELADTQEALTQTIDADRSPANLAARAAKLGMVPADSAAFLRLSDGKVLGVASAARPEPGFTVVTAPQVAPATAGAGKAGTGKAGAAAGTTTRTTVSKKGAVTTTTTVVTKPDGTVVTTVTKVNALTHTTTTTTTTNAPTPRGHGTAPTKPKPNTTPTH